MHLTTKMVPDKNNKSSWYWLMKKNVSGNNQTMAIGMMENKWKIATTNDYYIDANDNNNGTESSFIIEYKF